MSGSTSNLLWEVPNNAEPDDADVEVDTRYRLGYPLLTAVGTTVSDASAARAATEGIPASGLPAYDEHDNPLPPQLTDPLADVKRALSYSPETGVNFISGAQFSNYLKGNFDTRIADGAVLLQAVDQTLGGNSKPGLTYFRLGKPEPKLTDPTINTLRRDLDLLMDQKYTPGVGLFSDGGFEAWTKKPINFRSNKQITLTAPTFYSTSYGENFIATYEIESEDDIARVNAGEVKDVDVPRSIVNVTAMRKTDLGWYKQIVDRGRSLAYSTSNKGEFGIGSSYGLSVGTKFEHSIAVSLGTSYSGKVEINKGFDIEIGTTGAIFKHPFGSWTQEDEAELTGNTQVNLSIAGIDTAPIKIAMTIYSIALHASVAVQTLAFTAYNAVLAGQADRTLEDADMEDDYYGLGTTLDHGMKIYEAALSLSAITCAAGIVMAAVQAAWSRLRVPDPMTPDIQLSRQGIFLRYGPNGIEIGPSGVKIAGLLGGVTIGGVSLTHAAPAVNHQPVPPIIPIMPRGLTG